MQALGLYLTKDLSRFEKQQDYERATKRFNCIS